MSSFNPEQTTRGTWKCPYCNHKSWKQFGAGVTHIHAKHPVEAESAKQAERNTKLQADNERLQRELKACRNKPAPEPKKEKEYYQCVLYCRAENRVFRSGMPKGVLPENVTCSTCGNQSLTITSNDPNGIL